MISSIVQKCNTPLQAYKDEEASIILQRLKKNNVASIGINLESIEIESANQGRSMAMIKFILYKISKPVLTFFEGHRRKKSCQKMMRTYLKIKDTKYCATYHNKGLRYE